MMAVGVVGAFVRRDWIVTRSYRLQHALEGVSLLFQLSLFFYIAQVVDKGGTSDLPGLSQGYFPFLLVGMALYNLLSIALSSVTSTLTQEQTTGSLEALLTTPQPSVLLIVATSSYPFIRAAINMLLYIGIGVAVFGVRFHLALWSTLAAATTLVTSLVLFGALGILVAAFALVYKRATAFLGLLTSAIALLSGVFFPVSVLPDPLRAVSNLLPVTWALSTTRRALLEGVVDVSKLVTLVLVSGFLLPLAIWTLSQALRKARQDGSLGQY